MIINFDYTIDLLSREIFLDEYSIHTFSHTMMIMNPEAAERILTRYYHERLKNKKKHLNVFENKDFSKAI